MSGLGDLHVLRAAIDQYALQALDSREDAQFWVSTFPVEMRLQLLVVLWGAMDERQEAEALKAILDVITPEQLSRVHAYAAKKLERKP